MKKVLLCAISFAFLFSAAVNADQIPPSFFDRFFPPSLTTVAGRAVPLNQRNVVFTIGSLSKGTAPVAVAIFTNSVQGAVSVISVTGQGVVMATAAPNRMVGSSAGIALVDFDGTGNQNIVVTMNQSRGLPTTWIFRWTGSALQPINPGTGAGDRFRSTLGDATFADLDGSGRISVIDYHAGNSTAKDGTVTVNKLIRIFRYVNGAFEDTGARPDLFEMFMRGKGSPAPQTETFDISDPDRSRDVVIINGGGVMSSSEETQDDKSGVSSAQVTLNGSPIATEKDFREDTKLIRVSVHLNAHNEIGVTINGGPQSTLTILVTPK